MKCVRASHPIPLLSTHCSAAPQLQHTFFAVVHNGLCLPQRVLVPNNDEKLLRSRHCGVDELAPQNKVPVAGIDGQNDDRIFTSLRLVNCNGIRQAEVVELILRIVDEVAVRFGAKFDRKGVGRVLTKVGG